MEKDLLYASSPSSSLALLSLFFLVSFVVLVFFGSAVLFAEQNKSREGICQIMGIRTREDLLPLFLVALFGVLVLAILVFSLFPPIGIPAALPITPL